MRFRRQRWTGWLALAFGGPFGLALLAGGAADGEVAVAVLGVGLLAWAGYGVRIVRGPVVLELDDEGFTDHRSGVRLAWDEIADITPRVRWRRGYMRIRTLEFDVRDPAVVRDRVTNRVGKFVVDHVPFGDRGSPALPLNVLAADANDVVDAFERRWGRPIEQRFTFTGTAPRAGR